MNLGASFFLSLEIPYGSVQTLVIRRPGSPLSETTQVLISKLISPIDDMGQLVRRLEVIFPGISPNPIVFIYYK
jgi:hypothetical protein